MAKCAGVQVSLNDVGCLCPPFRINLLHVVKRRRHSFPFSLNMSACLRCSDRIRSDSLPSGACNTSNLWQCMNGWRGRGGVVKKNEEW